MVQQSGRHAVSQGSNSMLQQAISQQFVMHAADCADSEVIAGELCSLAAHMAAIASTHLLECRLLALPWLSRCLCCHQPPASKLVVVT
jgi:hypothetical protein